MQNKKIHFRSDQIGSDFYFRHSLTFAMAGDIINLYEYGHKGLKVGKSYTVIIKSGHIKEILTCKNMPRKEK